MLCCAVRLNDYFSLTKTFLKKSKNGETFSSPVFHKINIQEITKNSVNKISIIGCSKEDVDIGKNQLLSGIMLI